MALGARLYVNADRNGLRLARITPNLIADGVAPLIALAALVEYQHGLRLKTKTACNAVGLYGRWPERHRSVLSGIKKANIGARPRCAVLLREKMVSNAFLFA